MRWSPPALNWTRSLPTAVVTGLATLGPVGRVRRGPGTAGSAAGLLFYVVVWYPLGLVESLLLAFVAFWIGVALCHEAEARLLREDPPEVVLDEFLAMPLCFLGLGPTLASASWGGSLAVLAAGFVLFRFFDIVKPLGIARLQRLPGGLGIMVDDVAAAAATAFLLHVGCAWWWG